MTTERFDYQRACASVALDEDQGLVLNIGANDDPAHLKALDPERVVNCDIFDHDQVLDRPNSVDVLFDCARERWPFEDDSAALVILGDIVEHLKPSEITASLQEARRVGRRLCVTAPEDDRPETSDQEADGFPRGAVHRTVVTEELLRDLLTAAGWTVTEWRVPHYGFVARGHFVTAE